MSLYQKRWLLEEELVGNSYTFHAQPLQQHHCADKDLVVEFQGMLKGSQKFDDRNSAFFYFKLRQ